MCEEGWEEWGRGRGGGEKGGGGARPFLSRCRIYHQKRVAFFVTKIVDGEKDVGGGRRERVKECKASHSGQHRHNSLLVPLSPFVVVPHVVERRGETESLKL